MSIWSFGTLLAKKGITASPKVADCSQGYFRKANIAIVVFDLNQPESFVRSRRITAEARDIWIKSIRDNCDPDTVVVLVGNKSDLERKVNREDADILASKNDLKYIETSSLNGDNVRRVVAWVIRYSNMHVTIMWRTSFKRKESIRNMPEEFIPFLGTHRAQMKIMDCHSDH